MNGQKDSTTGMAIRRSMRTSRWGAFPYPRTRMGSVPALRASFPLAVLDASANFEIPFGCIERPADGEEAPALNWADLTGTAWCEGEDALAGATLVNNSKYGHQLGENGMRLTLLRSSYDPDPLPELGAHHISFGLKPHVGAFDQGQSIRAGYAFNHPLISVGTTLHAGEQPAEAAGIEILTPNVMVASVKKAEESGAVILRLFEFGGEDTKAEIWLSTLLAKAGSAVVETDVLEQPLANSTASMAGNVVTVDVPAFGVATVRIG